MRRAVIVLLIALLLTTTAYADQPVTNVYSRAYPNKIVPGETYRYELVVNSTPNTEIFVYFTPFGEVQKIYDTECFKNSSPAFTLICKIKTNEFGFNYVSFDIRSFGIDEIGTEACKEITHIAYVSDGSIKLEKLYPQCQVISLPVIKN